MSAYDDLARFAAAAVDRARRYRFGYQRCHEAVTLSAYGSRRWTPWHLAYARRVLGLGEREE